MPALTTGELLFIMFIGLGPIKPAVRYLGLIHGRDFAEARRIALMAIGAAGLAAFALLLLGDLLEALFHFSIPSIEIGGALILLVMGIQMALQHPEPEIAEKVVDAHRLALVPLGVPLTLNPIGMVTLIVGSSTSSVQKLVSDAAVIVAILLIDVVAFLVLARFRSVPPGVLMIAEVVLGILLAGLAVEVLFRGLADAGLIADIPHG